MLFNSGEFLLFFLPLTLALFALVRAVSSGNTGLISVLVLCSLFFYAWWEPAYLVLLLGSALGNYGFSRILHKHPSKALLALGVSANLGLLGFYKYGDFFIANYNWLSGSGTDALGLLLPLAISFFTFQQIAYLVDVYQEKARPGQLTEYLLFVCFFPQLIAGPIVHHKQVMPQFEGVRSRALTAAWLAPGLFVFCLGFIKKVFFADTLALYANPVFDNASLGYALSPLSAWLGTLTYTFQIYFDFSGYSDMAIGLAMMFGIRLPENFNSPYKSISITDFWRRWHMTLSQFLRDYLYIPLGGNRKGRARRYVNLFATMLLGGLWHGAGWTFVIWGGLHGLYLSVNHFWNHLWRAKNPPGWMNGRPVRLFYWALTFLAVVIAWVYFRAIDMATANHILLAMFGGTDWQQPVLVGSAEFGQFLSNRDTGVLVYADHLFWLTLSAVVAFFVPNSREITERLRNVNIRWLPPVAQIGALLACIGLLAAIGVSKNVTEFIYFNF